MSRTKQRVYLGVMGMCAIALAVDRLVLSGEQSGPASAHGETSRPGAPVFEPERSPLRQPIPELPFPRSLEPVDSVALIRDPFAPSDNGADMPGSVAGQTGDQNGEAKSAAAAFAASHRLEAIMADERLRIVIVDGRWLRIGDSIDGCRLTRVAGTGAYFECVDGPAVLELVVSEESRGG